MAVGAAGDGDRACRGQSRDRRARRRPPRMSRAAPDLFGLTGDGVAQVWTTIREHRSTLGPDRLAAKRAVQRWDFTWALVRDEMESRLHRSPELAIVRDDVRVGRIQAVDAADKII